MNLTNEQKAILSNMGFIEKHETVHSYAPGRNMTVREIDIMEYTFDDSGRSFQDTLQVSGSDPEYDEYILDFNNNSTGEIITRTFDTFEELLEFLKD